MLIVDFRYPLEPPRVTFVTPIYHPNIDSSGRICLDILKMPPTGAWKPLITIEGVLIAICNLMSCPNPNDPLVLDIVCILTFYFSNNLIYMSIFIIFRPKKLKVTEKHMNLKPNILLKCMLVLKKKIIKFYNLILFINIIFSIYYFYCISRNWFSIITI